MSNFRRPIAANLGPASCAPDQGIYSSFLSWRAPFSCSGCLASHASNNVLVIVFYGGQRCWSSAVPVAYGRFSFWIAFGVCATTYAPNPAGIYVCPTQFDFCASAKRTAQNFHCTSSKVIAIGRSRGLGSRGLGSRFSVLSDSGHVSSLNMMFSFFSRKPFACYLYH
jgi:hypothetical protein